MRKVLAFVGTILAAQALMAGPVSPGRALDIGRFILDGPATKGAASEVAILWDGEFADSPKVLEPAFYVVGREDGGFVIISADDNAQPVLGISETNRFSSENMPEHVRWWMEKMKAYVRSQAVQNEEVREQWAGLAGTRAGNITGTVTGKVEHLTPEWDQGNNDKRLFGQLVYNKYCPTIKVNGVSYWTYTGCVATALGEIMATLSELYPNNVSTVATGWVGGYTPTPGAVAPSAYELPWSEMSPYVYDWGSIRTMTGAAAIQKALREGNYWPLDCLGHLLADIGAAIHANYEFEGTGAYVDADMARRMAEHFYMSKTSVVESYDDHTAAIWRKKLKEEIALRPILYSGFTDQQAGHAFVFDGYGQFGGTDVFHVNFGWGGNNNGYYYFDNLATDLGTYSYQHVVTMLGFFPDRQQATSYPVSIRYNAFTPDGGPEYYGITANGAVTPGQQVSLRLGGIKNVGTPSFSGEVRFYLVDRNGTAGSQPLVNFTFASNPVNPGRMVATDGVLLTLPTGTFGDRIIGYYTSETGMKRIIVPADGTVVGELPLYPAAFIDTKASYAVGEKFPLVLKNYNRRYAGTVWIFTAPSGSVSTVTQDQGDFVFTESGEYRIQASVAPTSGGAVSERIVAFVNVL